MILCRFHYAFSSVLIIILYRQVLTVDFAEKQQYRFKDNDTFKTIWKAEESIRQNVAPKEWEY